MRVMPWRRWLLLFLLVCGPVGAQQNRAEDPAEAVPLALPAVAQRLAAEFHGWAAAGRILNYASTSGSATYTQP